MPIIEETPILYVYISGWEFLPGFFIIIFFTGLVMCGFALISSDLTMCRRV